MQTFRRREFLTALAAIGSSGPMQAAKTGAKKTGARSYRVDIHHHLFPPDYSAAIVSLGQPPSPAWTPAKSLEEMDKSGIALSMLSLSPPNVVFPDAALARRL